MTKITIDKIGKKKLDNTKIIEISNTLLSMMSRAVQTENQ